MRGHPRLMAGRRDMTLDREQALHEAAPRYTRLAEADGAADLADAFEEWLEADPDHAGCWAEIVATARGIERVEPLDRDRWERPPAATPAPARRWRPARWKAAAVLLAAACMAVLVLPEAMLRLDADQMTGTAEVRELPLPDGSRAVLAPSSAVAVDFTAGRRAVRLLRGQAWFEVTPDPAHPFRVTARQASATVLGTRFDVRAHGDTTEVAVAQGRVRVDGADGNPAGVLEAGQWARIGAARGRETGTLPPASLGAWRAGEIVVQDGTVAGVIDALRPWYRGRIVLAGRQVAARPVSGFYKADDPVRAVRNLVEPNGGQVTIVTPWLLIVTDR